MAAKVIFSLFFLQQLFLCVLPYYLPPVFFASGEFQHGSGLIGEGEGQATPENVLFCKKRRVF